MDALVTQSRGPLWYDRYGQPLPFPEDLAYFAVKRDTGGRPIDQHDSEGNPLHIEADADFETFLQATRDQVGNFFLFPYASDHKRLGQIAYVRVLPEHVGLAPDDQPAQSGGVSAELVVKELFKLLHRNNETHESNALVLQKTIESQSSALVNIFGNVGKVLNSTSATISVANGIEKLDREQPPAVDVEELATQLDGTIKDAANKQAPPKWMPLVSMAMQGAQGFAQAFLDKQKAKEAAAPPAPIPQPAPTPIEPELLMDDDESTEKVDNFGPAQNVVENDIEPDDADSALAIDESIEPVCETPTSPALSRLEQIRRELAIEPSQPVQADAESIADAERSADLEGDADVESDRNAKGDADIHSDAKADLYIASAARAVPTVEIDATDDADDVIANEADTRAGTDTADIPRLKSQTGTRPRPDDNPPRAVNAHGERPPNRPPRKESHAPPRSDE